MGKQVVKIGRKCDYVINAWPLYSAREIRADWFHKSVHFGVPVAAYGCIVAGSRVSFAVCFHVNQQ